MRYAIIVFGVFLFISCGGAGCPAQPEQPVETMKSPADIYDYSQAWVDSVYKTLSPERRIAQLFWIAIENPGDITNYQHLKNLVKTYQPGGIILFGMSPHKAVDVIQQMQHLSELPLLVSVDGENGLAMRFPGLVAFPNAMSLGAISNDSLIYQMGLEIARQCQIMDIHVNLAPVADVNVNPANPIIGVRSFGEDPSNVARKTAAYVRGLQEGGIMAVGKHFPGHGDTDKDSHKTLPRVRHNRSRLDSVELFPFKALIDTGLWAVMSAHLEVPALEKQKNIPASFSKRILVDQLRQTMQFKGLIVTDAVNMQGAKSMGRPGVVDALALAAGNDVVEFTEDLPEAIEQVKIAIDQGKLTWNQIGEKCKRTLAFKHYLTQQTDPIVATDSLLAQLNSYEARRLNQQLYEASVTVLNNRQNVFPFVTKPELNTSVVVVGEAPVLSKGIQERFGGPVYYLSATDGTAFDKQFSLINPCDRYIVVIADSQWGRRNENYARKERLEALACRDQSVVLFLGHAYHLRSWDRLKNSAGLAIVYQNTDEAQDALLRFISGEIKASGQLPVTVGNMYKAGDGIVAF